MIIKALRWLGLMYDPSKALKWEKPKRQTPKAIKLADDLQLGAMGLEKVKHTEDSVEWGAVKNQKEYTANNRTASITDVEKAALLEEGLDLIKAQEIKRFWIMPDMSRESAASIINKKGFSSSSIKPYWTIFNKWA